MFKEIEKSICILSTDMKVILKKAQIELLKMKNRMSEMKTLTKFNPTA